ncbi:MAG TPA: acetoin utilization AcuC family protein [Candidatus Limnocylindrales bacterium]
MLLVYGPRSATYDFGPGHPLTPRRFGPGIELLRSVGAEPGLSPEPAPDDELLWVHTRRYIETVKRFSADPFGFGDAGIGEGGDDPPFAGMHEAGAMVAGGSLRAVEAVLRGDVEHAFHPGGGLHHAMPDHASGFCIYDDPALAIARARRDGLRVLYVDFDVHHGDGVQAIHWSDPGVLTLSFHESGRYLFPGTGGVGELGEGVAAGTSVNVPMEPGTGEAAWLGAVRLLLPEVAAAFGPDLIVSQHGADSHAWDPLAHLSVTTTAMGEAARLVDRLSHRHAGGRWLATGGGGYDAYRVVPRSWSLVWLAGAHREVPAATPAAWRERWQSEGARYGQAPLPATFEDAPNAGVELDATQAAAEAVSLDTAAVVRRLVVPRSLQVARDRGWWDPEAATSRNSTAAFDASSVMGDPAIVVIDAPAWERLRLAPRVIAPADPVDAHALILAALRDGASVSAAIDGTAVVGLAVVGPSEDDAHELLAVGVAPAFRQRGLARALLASVTAAAGDDVELRADVTLAERDPVDPLDRRLRAELARRLLHGAGFEEVAVDPDLRDADQLAIRAVRRRATTTVRLVPDPHAARRPFMDPRRVAFDAGPQDGGTRPGNVGSRERSVCLDRARRKGHSEGFGEPFGELTVGSGRAEDQQLVDPWISHDEPPEFSRRQ